MQDEHGTVHAVTLEDIMTTLAQMDSSSVNSLLFGDEKGGDLDSLLASVSADVQTQPQSHQQPIKSSNINNNNNHVQSTKTIQQTQNTAHLHRQQHIATPITTTTTPRPRGVIVRVNGKPVGGSALGGVLGSGGEEILGGTFKSVTSDAKGNVHITPEHGQTINIQDIIQLAEQVSGGKGHQQVIVGGARYPNLQQQDGQAGNGEQGQQELTNSDDGNEVSQFAHQLLRYLENGAESDGLQRTQANTNSSSHRHQPQILVQPKIKVTSAPTLPPQPQQQGLIGASAAGAIFPSLVSGIWSRLTGSEQQSQEQSSRAVFPRSPQTEKEAEEDYIQVILRNQKQNSAEDEQIGLITIPLPRPIHFQTTTTTPSPIIDTTATTPRGGLTGIINTLTGNSGGGGDDSSSGGLTGIINTLYNIGGSRSSNPSTRSVSPSESTSSEYLGNKNGLPPVLHYLSPAVQETLWQQANSEPKFNLKGSSSRTQAVNRRMDDGSVEFISTEEMDEEDGEGSRGDTYNFNPIPSHSNTPISSQDFMLESPTYSSPLPGLDSSSPSVVKKPGVSSMPSSSQSSQPMEPSHVINVSPKTMSVLSRVLPSASFHSQSSSTGHNSPHPLPQVPPSAASHHTTATGSAIRRSQVSPVEHNKRYATVPQQASHRQATAAHKDPLGLPASLVQRLPTNVLDNLREQYVSSRVNRLPDSTSTTYPSLSNPDVAQDRGFNYKGKGKGGASDYLYYELPSYHGPPTTYLYDTYYEPPHEYLPYDDQMYGDDSHHHEHSYSSHEYSEPKHPLFDIFLLADVTKVHKIGDSNFSIKAPKIGDSKYFVDTWSQHGRYYKHPHHHPYYENYHHLPSYHAKGYKKG